MGESFEDVVRPVIKWLAENGHPHMTIIIDQTSAELLEGTESVITNDYLLD